MRPLFRFPCSFSSPRGLLHGLSPFFGKRAERVIVPLLRHLCRSPSKYPSAPPLSSLRLLHSISFPFRLMACFFSYPRLDSLIPPPRCSVPIAVAIAVLLTLLFPPGRSETSFSLAVQPAHRPFFESGVPFFFPPPLPPLSDQPLPLDLLLLFFTFSLYPALPSFLSRTFTNYTFIVQRVCWFTRTLFFKSGSFPFFSVLGFLFPPHSRFRMLDKVRSNRVHAVFLFISRPPLSLCSLVFRPSCLHSFLFATVSPKGLPSNILAFIISDRPLSLAPPPLFFLFNVLWCAG